MSFTERDRAESFGQEAERYDRTRPRYPDALWDEILGVDASGLSVLDVGCGTGIASRQMAARGATVLGVEVDPLMADLARRLGSTVEVGAFESWDPRGRRFSRVTAGQSWHWIDPVAGAARAADVLVPGGRLCAFWNIGRPPDPLAADLETVYAGLGPRPTGGGSPTGAEDGMRACAELDPPVRHLFPWVRRYERDEWLEQLATHSDHAVLAPADRRRLITEVGRAIDAHGGSFDMHYDTLLVSARRR